MAEDKCALRMYVPTYVCVYVRTNVCVYVRMCVCTYKRNVCKLVRTYTKLQPKTALIVGHLRHSVGTQGWPGG